MLYLYYREHVPNETGRGQFASASRTRPVRKEVAIDPFRRPQYSAGLTGGRPITGHARTRLMVLVSGNRLTAAADQTPVEWEEVDCPLCGGAHRRLLLEAPDRCPEGQGLRFAVVRCLECGLCYTNPRPSPRSIARFSPAGYRPHQLAARPAGVKWWRRYPGLPRWLIREQPPQDLPGAGRLLDFGCGGG